MKKKKALPSFLYLIPSGSGRCMEIDYGDPWTGVQENSTPKPQEASHVTANFDASEHSSLGNENSF